MNGIRNFLNGFFIGIVNAIPGVSGGTIAFLLGIYEQFIDALSNISDVKNKNFKKRLVFLIQVGAGTFLGIFTAFNILSHFFETQEEILRFFFLGLILFSIPGILSAKLKKVEKKDVVFGFLGLIIVWVLSLQSKNLNTSSDLNSVFYVAKLFTVSFIAAGAMILPGLSGGFLLLIFGEYENISKYVSQFNLFAIFIVGSGFLVGILFLAKIMDNLFKNYREETMSTVLGIVIGSTISIFPSPITIENIFLDILFFIIGGFLVLKLSKVKN